MILLPSDIWFHIGSYLPKKQKKRLSYANKALFSLFHQSIFLKKLPPANLIYLFNKVSHIETHLSLATIIPLCSGVKSISFYTFNKQMKETIDVFKNQYLTNLQEFELMYRVPEREEEFLSAVAKNCPSLRKMVLHYCYDKLPLFPALEEIKLPLNSESLAISLKKQNNLKKVEVRISKLEYLNWIDPSYEVNLSLDVNLNDVFDLDDAQLMKLKKSKLCTTDIDDVEVSFLYLVSCAQSAHPKYKEFVKKCAEMGFKLFPFPIGLSWEIRFFLISLFPDRLKHFLPIIASKEEAKQLYELIIHSEKHKKYFLYFISLLVQSQQAEFLDDILPSVDMVNLFSEQGENIYHLLSAKSIHKFNLELLEKFKEVDINKKDSFNRSPLEIALKQDKPELCTYYLSKNCEVRLEAWILLFHKKETTLLELFISERGIPLSHNGYNQNILHLAFYHDAPARVILKLSFKLTTPLFYENDIYGYTPLALGRNRYMKKVRGNPNHNSVYSFLSNLK